MHNGSDLHKNLRSLQAAVEAFARDMADEIGKPPSARSLDVLGRFRETSNELYRRSTVLGHAAGHAKIALLRDTDRQPSHKDTQALQTIQSHAMDIRSRVNWAFERFERQMIGPAIPLYDEPFQDDDPKRTIFEILESALAAMDFMSSPGEQDETARELGCFPDIRLKPHEFAAHALAAYRVSLVLGRYGKAQFLDVGCGGGSKLLLASRYFSRADGIEFDPGYAGSARRLIEACGLLNCEVHEANALAFESYDDYDVVYFYQPMNNTEALHDLERIIASSVRPDTILVAPYLSFASRAEELGAGHVDGRIFVAGADAQRAKEIREAAEHTGVQIVHEIEDGRWNAAWRPAREAFAANGFFV